MKTTYTVENICGGTCHRGKSLDRAIQATRDHFARPYIRCAKGVRPVVWVADDEGEEYAEVGEYGETCDQLRARVEA